MDIMATLLAEGSKTVVSEICKAGVRALLTRMTQQAATPQVEHAHSAVEFGPLVEAEQAVNGFFQCLTAADHDAAWAWCDPAWATDPERSSSFHETFSYTPPLQCSVRQQYVPGDWTEGKRLGWVAMDVVVTFDNGDGTFSAHPAAVVAMLLGAGWRVAEVVWYPDAEVASERAAEEQAWQVGCERCPQELSIPFGSGPFSTRCPACWTPQTIDRDALIFDFSFQEQPIEAPPDKRVIRCGRCSQKLSVPVGVGRIRLKCPSCRTLREIDT